jgi:hypothetical protein
MKMKILCLLSAERVTSHGFLLLQMAQAECLFFTDDMIEGGMIFGILIVRSPFFAGGSSIIQSVSSSKFALIT